MAKKSGGKGRGAEDAERAVDSHGLPPVAEPEGGLQDRRGYRMIKRTAEPSQDGDAAPL